MSSSAAGAVCAKGPKSFVMTYSVYRQSELESVIIPFFERHPLVSRKRMDFAKFSDVVRAMQRKEHLSADGFRRIVRVAFSMNQHGKQRRYSLGDVFAEPSETARQAPASQPAKIQSDPHGDVRRAAEMTAPPDRPSWGRSGGNSDA